MEENSKPSAAQRHSPIQASPAAAPSKLSKRDRRKRRRDAHLVESYEGFTITPIPPPPPPSTPGTPHSQFAACYRVVVQTTKSSSTTDTDATTPMLSLRVHRHVNGLVVVTMDDDDTSSAIWRDERWVDVRYHVSVPTTATSAAQKRKQNDLLLRGNNGGGGTLPGTVHPSDILVSFHTTTTNEDDGAVLQVPCCVLGTVMEINERLTMDLLRSDPLLKGYLAIILPASPFPPKLDTE